MDSQLLEEIAKEIYVRTFDRIAASIPLSNEELDSKLADEVKAVAGKYNIALKDSKDCFATNRLCRPALWYLHDNRFITLADKSWELKEQLRSKTDAELKQHIDGLKNEYLAAWEKSRDYVIANLEKAIVSTK